MSLDLFGAVYSYTAFNGIIVMILKVIRYFKLLEGPPRHNHSHLLPLANDENASDRYKYE